MGRIGIAGSDYAIVTSDNPRTEDPDAIVRDIIAGLPSGDWEAIVDRREAIRRALELAGEDDGVLLAGKGHETYQEVGEERQPFDECVVVAELLAQRREAE
jgi:UDP-N-acetylmuramoyl-L-alanyl-D-glutamate--2,6-diaminopimelate ligase